MFDIEAGLGEGKDARKKLSRIQGCVRHLGEIYSRETLHAQALRHGLRLFAEAELRAALSPGKGQKTSDITVYDGRRWAVFEVTSSRLTRASVSSTREKARYLPGTARRAARRSRPTAALASMAGDPIDKGRLTSGPVRSRPLLEYTEHPDRARAPPEAVERGAGRVDIGWDRPAC